MCAVDVDVEHVFMIENWRKSCASFALILFKMIFLLLYMKYK